MRLILAVSLAMFFAPGGAFAGSCEILYASMPHEVSASAIGKSRIEKVLSLPDKDRYRYTTAMLAMTREIAAEMTKAPKSGVEVEGHAVVMGGFNGRSFPSAIVTVEVDDENGPKTLKSLAAALGFVYGQQGVLVSCPDSVPKGFTALPWLKVTGADGVDLTKQRAMDIYDRMISYFKSADNTGYTYYPDRKLFSVLEFGKENQQKAALVFVAASLKKEAQDKDVIRIDEAKTSVSYFANDWAADENGEGYLKIVSDNTAAIKLREEFKNKIDSYFRTSSKL